VIVDYFNTDFNCQKKIRKLFKFDVSSPACVRSP